jgi:hypothetical protein
VDGQLYALVSVGGLVAFDVADDGGLLVEAAKWSLAQAPPTGSSKMRSQARMSRVGPWALQRTKMWSILGDFAHCGYRTPALQQKRICQC